MKRFTFLALICMIMAIGLAAATAMAADAPTDPIEMKFPSDNNKYAPIMFEHHAKHLGLKDGCVSCHHKWDGASAVQGCRIEGCHSDTSKEMKKEPTSYDSAFHARNAPNSCVGCHTAQLKDNPDSKAPKKCNECHTKK